MKIGQYCQRQRCRHAALEQFWQAFASRGFVSDSWAFLYILVFICLFSCHMWQTCRLFSERTIVLQFTIDRCIVRIASLMFVPVFSKTTSDLDLHIDQWETRMCDLDRVCFGFGV